jgi:hypothetical protein
MSRSEAPVLEQNEANTALSDEDAGPIIVPIARAERSFRWISRFRNEPKFELAKVSGPTDPDRAA